MDVSSQQESDGWNLYKFAYYFKNPNLRSKVMNVISLEFSQTKLAELVSRPKAIQEMDWVDLMWPLNSPDLPSPPKVQFYCLMSAKDCFTDFHIDFGGTSVYYHLLSGEKEFLFIRPTEENLEKFKNWTSSPEQNEVFFADLVSECYKVVIKEGETMVIPTGWIHAVFTPKDSIVIGGNFLHGFNIGLQLQVDLIEEETLVPTKFRFPHYFKMLWFAAQYYLVKLKGLNS